MSYSARDAANRNWKDAGRNMDVTTDAVMTQIPIASDGVAEKSTPLFTADWLRCNVTGSAPSGPVKSLAGTFTEIALPRSAGKCTEFLIKLRATVAGKFVSQDEASFVLPPTAYWFDRVEIVYNGSVVEQIVNDTLFAESAIFQSDMEYNQIAPLLNVSKAANLSGQEVACFKVYTASPASFQASPNQTLFNGTIGVNGNLYLPIVGVLGSIQPFLNGFNGEWRVRLYWSNTIDPTVFSDSTTMAAAVVANDFTDSDINPVGSTDYANVSIENVEMWIKQASLDMEKTQALRDLHTNGSVVYRGMRHTYQNTSQPLGLSPSADATVPLTSLSSRAAALYAYVVPNVQVTEDVLTRFPLTQLYLSDSGSVAMSPPIPSELLENYTSAGAIPIPSYFVNSPSFTNYIIPFAANLQNALYGKQSGSFQFTAQEKFVYRGAGLPVTGGVALQGAPPSYSGPQASISGLNMVFISYDYCEVKVSRGDMMLSTR